ncbi:uncharacterized protein LOC135843398 [Planococcus citri]|uniref:uncharacterized protein LOC135843398 n=1 Tax=Planococcus citri TaxID=170843 RepID=UPI0031F89384
MKNGVYLLLGLMVIIRSSHGIQDNNPFCKYNDTETNLTANCYHKADIVPFGLSNYIPLGNLSRSITFLTFQTISNDQTWHIFSTNYFSRFKNLSTLRIHGAMSFSPDLSRDKLTEKLFNVPTLKELVLSYNGFNSNYHLWILPTQLRNLTVTGYGYSEFSLKQNPFLKSINFHQTSLVSMPELSDPPPPLEVVDFRNNPLLEINVDKIALFCRAEMLALDADNLLTPQMYCECDRIKKWIKLILNQPETNIFNKTLNCSKPATEDPLRCQNYTLDKAKQNRELCLQLSTSDLVNIQPANQPSGSLRDSLIIIGIVGAILAISIVVGAVSYAYFSRPPPETFMVAAKQEDEKEPEDTDDELEPEMSDDEDDRKKDIYEDDRKKDIFI